MNIKEYMACCAAACVSAACAGPLEASAADRDRLSAAYSNCLSRIDRPAEGVVVPVETHPDGSVKLDVAAEKAQFFEKEGLVWCGGVTIREYTPAGEVKFRIEAEGCIIDRRTKSGWIEGVARGTYGKTDLAGRGVWFSSEDEAVEICSGVEIVSRDLNMEGIRL